MWSMSSVRKIAPFSPGRTRSGAQPTMSETITARPAHITSLTTRPQASWPEGRMKASQRSEARGSCDCGTKPSTLTLPGAIAAARASTSARSGPSPAKARIGRRSAGSACTRAKASSSCSGRLRSMSLPQDSSTGRPGYSPYSRRVASRRADASSAPLRKCALSTA